MAPKAQRKAMSLSPWAALTTAGFETQAQTKPKKTSVRHNRTAVRTLARHLRFLAFSRNHLHYFLLHVSIGNLYLGLLAASHFRFHTTLRHLHGCRTTRKPRSSLRPAAQTTAPHSAARIVGFAVPVPPSNHAMGINPGGLGVDRIIQPVSSVSVALIGVLGPFGDIAEHVEQPVGIGLETAHRSSSNIAVIAQVKILPTPFCRPCRSGRPRFRTYRPGWDRLPSMGRFSRRTTSIFHSASVGSRKVY